MTTSPVPSKRRSFPRTVAPSTTPADQTSVAVGDGGSAANTGLDAADHAIAAQSIGMEIALRDLIRAHGSDETMTLFGAAHEAFATRIAGISGIPASKADSTFMADHESAFADDAAMAVEAAEFEAAGRYVAWMKQISDGRLITAFASIAVAESRQAALLAVGTGLDAALDGPTGAGS